MKFDNVESGEWNENFEKVVIPSTVDNNLQKAYIFKSKSEVPKPLVVGLHTWSGDYTQKDEIAELCVENDMNYIHPDFRGPNCTIEACCSELALNDIDDAITYAIDNSNVDTSKIFVIGVSGGGYATLSTFMKSTHKIKKFSAWASIVDLNAWYRESIILKNRYAQDILYCTGSKNRILNEEEARQRSPLFWKTPLEKISKSEINIYAGIYDGIRGSVPITHSINFYNKILSDLGVNDPGKFISDKEKLALLENRLPLGDFGSIAERKIFLKKGYGNIKITIFEGDHEMLIEFAFNELVNK